MKATCRGVRLPPDLDERLTAFARLRRATISEVIVAAVDTYLREEAVYARIEDAVRKGLAARG